MTPPPGASAATATIPARREAVAPALERRAHPRERHIDTPRRDTLHRRSLAAGDIVALVAAFSAAALVLPGQAAFGSRPWLLIALPLWVVLNKILRLYDRDANLIHKSTLDELPSIAHSVLLGTGLLYLATNVTRAEAITFCAFALVAVPAARAAARTLVRAHVPPERVLIVGSGAVANVVERKLLAHPEYGSTLVGHADGEDVGRFEETCHALDVERVVVTFSSNLSHEQLLDLVRTGRRLGVKLTIVPRLFEAVGQSVEIDQVEGMTMLGLRSLRRTKSTLMLKRAVDVTLSVLALLALAPLLVLAALAIRLDSPGPVIFRQRRVGRRNREFTMFKFRTMVDGADAMKDELADRNELVDGVMFKIADDPRITRVGRLLRRASIDELPQLINVVRGEMSLVGPRPLVPRESDHLLGWHRARLDIAPGLTGPWQVLGRTAIPFEEMVKLDCLYVTEWSLWNDAKLLIRTLPVVVRRKGL